MTELNESGRAYARSLIAAGKVDKDSAWDFSAEDGNALLGAGGQDWTTYGKVHLGVDKSATDKTKARWKYPFAKGGKVYKRALDAIRSRASQEGDTAVFNAAGDLLDQITGKGKSGDEALAGRFEAKAAPFEFKFTDGDGDEPGTFEGYASTFDTEDDGGDLIQPGAFDRTLAQAKAAGRMPKMLLNHGGMGGYFSQPSPEDMLPIGSWKSMSPDSHGLQVKGKLINLDTELGKRVYGAMKEGELSDLSIGYIPRDFTYGKKPNEPRRTLKAVDLLEVSPVTFPMNRLANINAVKQRLGLMAPPQTVREFEEFLREVGGYSHAQAKAIASQGFKASEPRDEDVASKDDVRGLIARIQAAV